MTSDANPPPTPASDVPAPPVSPRAFAQGTGFVLQVVGVLLFLTHSCVCVSAGLWDQSVTSAATRPSPVASRWEQFTNNPAQAGVMLMVMSTLVAGLGFMILGLGLQGERVDAAWGAMVTGGLWLLALLLAGAGMWARPVAVYWRVWHGVAVLAAVLLLGFVVVALRQLRRFPPPVRDNTLPKDFDLNSLRHRY